MQVKAPFAEALSDALLELGAQSVTIEDARADTAEEIPCYGEPGFDAVTTWRDSRLSAIVDRQSDARKLVESAASAAGLRTAPDYGVTPVEDEDWVRRTQSQFGPLRVGRRLWIVPSWCAPPAECDALVLRLDPGLAFGTGSHPTTRLILEWLEGALGSGPLARSKTAWRVLDYGCGSGILALAAAKLGASEVVAVDLDSRALAACIENARANRVPIQVMSPERLPPTHYDLVLANILARPLIELAPIFVEHTIAGAQIALSGVLAGQAPEVIAGYEPAFQMRIEASAEDWVLLVGRRR
jgi:ribosomal protein L11 methyltransferase